jgi:hypothetical protein
VAVRNFGGADSLILLPGALTGVTPGPWTAAILWKRSQTIASALLTIALSGSNASASFTSKFWSFISTGGADDPNVAFVDSTATATTVADVVNADGWVISVVTKAGGSAIPRFHNRYLTAASTLRGDGAAALANGATITSADRVEFGKDEYFNRLSGRIALSAVWDVAFTDAQVDELWANLCTFDWLAHSLGAPKALWQFNQGSAWTDVRDLTGGGADQVALTGTSVVDGDDPPGWRYLSPALASLDLRCFPKPSLRRS